VKFIFDETWLKFKQLNYLFNLSKPENLK
jgi:hypothetical protein